MYLISDTKNILNLFSNEIKCGMRPRAPRNTIKKGKKNVPGSYNNYDSDCTEQGVD